MCLTLVDETKKTCTEGYKVFLSGSLTGKLYPLYYNKWGSFALNSWVTDTASHKIQAISGDFYETGFHFFFEERDAQDWAANNCSYAKVKKVMVRHVVATGIQSTKKVGVAKEIYICEKV